MCCKNKATIVLKTVQNIYLVAKNEKCQDKNVIFYMEIVKIKGEAGRIYQSGQQHLNTTTIKLSVGNVVSSCSFQTGVLEKNSEMADNAFYLVPLANLLQTFVT